MNAKVLYWGRLVELLVDPLDEQVVHVFTTGQCHSFARALARLTGWQLAVMTYDWGDTTFWHARGNGDHVVVIAPNGNLVDIYGEHEHQEHPMSDLVGLVPLSDAQVARLDWDKQDVERAMPFARALLDAGLVPSYVAA